MKAVPVDTLIVINRHEFRLRLYKRESTTWEFKLRKDYRVAIGALGHKTPKGVYLVNVKARNPTWTVPDSQWAIDMGLVPGTVIPGGDPHNPIRERWIGITDPEGGVGIHGTLSLDSIGTAASHGCIRMSPPDVIDLYDRVPKYTPIVIE